MKVFQVVVQGTLNPDGTLRLNEPPQLAPGPVEVVIRAQPSPKQGDTWWEYLQQARAQLVAQGQIIRTREEIDQERSRQRAADETRRQGIQDLQKNE